MKNKLLSTLGICRKAGKLKWGFDVVAQAAADGEAQLIVLAGDISPKTEKEIRFKAEKHGAEVIKTPVTMEEIWFRVGKRAAILAVTDTGLARTTKDAIIRTIEEE